MCSRPSPTSRIWRAISVSDLKPGLRTAWRGSSPGFANIIASSARGLPSARSEREQTCALDIEQCQISGCIGTGVDIGPIGQNLRAADRRMAMHDVFAKVLLALKKFLANPQQVAFALLRQRRARPDAGMHEKEIAAGETQPQAAEKLVMLRRHCGGQLS